jgi:hypothetical protein
VYCQGNNQSEPDPVAFSGARKQTFGLELIQTIELRDPHAACNVSHLQARAMLEPSIPRSLDKS